MNIKRMALQASVIIGMMLYICGCGATKQIESTTVQNANQRSNAKTADENDGKTLELQEDAEGPRQSGQTEESADGGYCFTTHGVSVKVDMDMDGLASELGEPNSVFEAPSCAGEGISYIYNYIDYEIETYPAEDGKNRIAYVILKDDMVSTMEGIDLSMTREDVILTYGEEYEEAEDSIIYEKDGMKLYFIFDEDNITSIEYASSVMD